MIRARLNRMASGHIVAVFKTDDKVTYTRVVGSSNDQLAPTAQWVKQNFICDRVGFKNDDGNTVWLGN